MLSNMTGLSCDHLRELLDPFDSSTSCESQNILIIDCRSFLAHNASHIINSINVFCPPFLRRRNVKKPLLETIITDDCIRDRILSDHYFHIILYEELDFTNDSIGFYVARILEDAGIKSINYLEGGFAVFKKQYPLLCTNTTTNAVFISSIVNKTKRTNTKYIHTWPFKSKTSCSFKPLTPRQNTKNRNNFPAFVIEEETGPAEILPYLFLGSESHAKTKTILTNLGITAILNVSQNCPNYFEEEFSYKRIPIRDSKCDDITPLINEALEFIDAVRSSNENGKILVHCRAGISRSATICIAHLIKSKLIPMEEAFEFVKSRRCLISPNFNFMTQLLEFEDQVFSQKKL